MLPHLYRRRLVNQLNDVEHRIIYIFGPAGFGKSLLVRQWSETQELPTVFFEGFSTPNASDLFNSFIDSIIQGIPKLETKFSRMRNLEQIDTKTIEEFIFILTQDKTPFNLIIENAESIRRLHNEFSQVLVRNMPKHVKLVLITATPPSAEFIRDYGVDRLITITPEALKFTREELISLAQLNYPSINDEEVDEVLSFTEGWPAGIHLILSQISDKNDFNKVIDDFKSKGKNEFLALAQRVLANIEPKKVEMLTQLCLSQDIDAELIIGITDDNDAVRQFTLLSQETIAVLQIKSAPPKFKIHPLLREVLLDELRRRPDFHEIVEKTIKNLLDRGCTREVTEILIEIGETTRLTSLLQEPEIMKAIDVSIQDSIAKGEVSDLQSWQNVTRYMPKVGNLGFNVLNFYVALLKGKFNEAQSHIHNLEATLLSLEEKMAKEWRADLSAMQSILHFANGRLSESWKSAMEAFTLAQKHHGVSRHQTSYLQFALWSAILRDSDKDLKVMSDVLEQISSDSSSPSRRINIRMMRALLSAYEGRFIEAQNNLSVAMTPMTNSIFQGFFGAFAVKTAEAHCLAEAGKTLESQTLFEEIFRESIQGKNFPIAISTLGRLSFLYFLAGDAEKSLAAIRDARTMVESELLSPELHDCIDIWEMRIRLNLRDFDRVQELLNRSKSTYMVKAFEAAINIEKNPAKAKSIIDTFDLSILRQAMTFHLFNAHLLHDAPGKQLNEVRKAVDVGSRHGYFKIFLIQRSDVIQQYITLAAESPTAFNERLARAAGERLNEMMVGQGSTTESLTRREADILRHLATGLPLKEIAGNLNISKNTIKTHLRNLYRKLGAEDRTDAVEKGKRLLKV